MRRNYPPGIDCLGFSHLLLTIAPNKQSSYPFLSQDCTKIDVYCWWSFLLYLTYDKECPSRFNLWLVLFLNYCSYLYADDTILYRNAIFPETAIKNLQASFSMLQTIFYNAKFLVSVLNYGDIFYLCMSASNLKLPDAILNTTAPSTYNYKALTCTQNMGGLPSLLMQLIVLWFFSHFDVSTYFINLLISL